MATAAERSPEGLPSLLTIPAQAPGFEEVVAALTRGETASLSGAWGSACALSVAALAARAPGLVVVVLPRLADTADFARDLEGFA